MCTLQINIRNISQNTNWSNAKGGEGVPHMACALLQSLPFCSQLLPYVATAVLGIPPNLAVARTRGARKVHINVLNVDLELHQHDMKCVHFSFAAYTK